MKVLLKEDVDNLGLAGEIHDVAGGYGRNYLIPRNLAVKATPGALKQADIWRQRAEARRAQLRSEYEALSARIEDTQLFFTAKAGETGKLYGSVTMNDVADALNQTLGIEIDKRKVAGEPLRQLGEHKVPIRLNVEFHPEVTVIIKAEGIDEEALEAEEAVEAEDVVAEAVDEAEEAEAAEEAEEVSEFEPEPEPEPEPDSEAVEATA